MAGYKVVKFNTAATAERKVLMAPNEAFSSFHVLAVPTGAEITVAIGGGELFPVFAGFSADFCPMETGGMVLQSMVAVTGEVIILLWQNGGTSGGPL